MTNTNNEVIKIGEYIVIQKQNYRKLHKFNKPNSAISLGRDTVNLNGIEGRSYFSFFKLESKNTKRNREFTVEFTEEPVTLKDEIDIKASGNDNRNIIDDGRSQKLTAADIQILKSDSSKASDIVETLITNSNTFHNKTEFSQEKYLNKKAKKYCEYIQILKPNLRMVAEIMYKLEPVKIQHLRIDTMSQLITIANISSDGVHLLYDSGSNGLLAAALMSAIGDSTSGRLVHMHPGNMSQKQALLAMNFSENQLQRCISVNVYSVLRQLYQGCDTNSNGKESNEVNCLKRKNDDEIEHESKVAKTEVSETITVISDIEKSSETVQLEDSDSKNEVKVQKSLDENEITEESLKKEIPAEENKLPEPKKPKWHFDNIAAAELLKNKADSLVIACKEDPQNIFNELVLPERTHPEVAMNGASGFILSGYILK
ncbi:tRNA (Adenine-N(1)-)-methyltransferase non-catalytic subunit TRM6 [Operophtera brumata]|uniref:tRNA (adenine(58)-N(1))-methyltransferase non-catalytic subunit TRM6 n=1 Tax=Operophtera brumata TaxID=104452 RepID=A0A0L7LR26_OPEBR|nr:tRNA (Adenine-N(1)-)-methyltransferase non-catalytic subunit TRM6 [Operophtera brumata]